MQIWNLHWRKLLCLPKKSRATFALGANWDCFPKTVGSGITCFSWSTGQGVFKRLLCVQPNSSGFCLVFPGLRELQVPWTGSALMLGFGVLLHMTPG